MWMARPDVRCGVIESESTLQTGVTCLRALALPGELRLCTCIDRTHINNITTYQRDWNTQNALAVRAWGHPRRRCDWVVQTALELLSDCDVRHDGCSVLEGVRTRFGGAGGAASHVRKIWCIAIKFGRANTANTKGADVVCGVRCVVCSVALSAGEL
jgi:hypothetical protein